MLVTSSNRDRFYIAISLVLLLFHSIYSKPTTNTQDDDDNMNINNSNNNNDDDEVVISKRTIGGIVDEIGKRPTNSNGIVRSSSSPPSSSSSSNNPSAGLFDDDSIRKNDDAHIRLFYKSNAPGRSVSHELEHRFIKNPNYQYNERVRQDSLNRMNPYTSYQSQPYWNNNNNNNLYNNVYQEDPIKDKQTMFNLHYHGNSMNEPQPQGIFLFFVNY